MANKEHFNILKQGVNVRNKWINKYPNIIPDLSGTELRGADFSEANLKEANFKEIEIDIITSKFPHSGNILIYNNKKISVIFDPSRTKKEEVLNLLLRLSDLYRAIGGKGLIIRDEMAFVKKGERIPVLD